MTSMDQIVARVLRKNPFPATPDDLSPHQRALLEEGAAANGLTGQQQLDVLRKSHEAHLEALDGTDEVSRIADDIRNSR